MKELYQPEAASTVLFAFIGNPWALLVCYLLVMNLIAFFSMLIDKRCAQAHARRIPEKLLFLWALLLGAPGGTLAMYAFRHKTQHWYFKLFFPLLALLQIALLLWLNARLLLA